MKKVNYRFFILFLFSSLLMLSTNVLAAKPVPVCGDGKCQGDETAGTCSLDCAVCGDGLCTGDETYTTCQDDCEPPPPPLCNNDGTCNEGEDCLSCPNDCNGITGGKPSSRYCCGADTCNESLCGVGCGNPITEPTCGDGALDGGEECDDGNTTSGDGCSANCTIESFCGDGTLDAGEECDDGNNTDGDGCSATCQLESSAVVPANQFNAGDSIGEGEAADGTIGEAHHETVWSTGYDGGDSVSSFNERFENKSAADYYENNATRDTVFNHAVSGAVMADFESQANAIVQALYSATPPHEAGMITVLLGSNDVCAPSLTDMTDPILFANQYRAGLEFLANDATTKDATIHISSIPAIYWLWNAKRTSFWCRVFAWPFVPCENLLDNPSDDCVNTSSRMDPDTIYDGDGPNCLRRKQFHANIRDIYNPILRDILQEEYIDTGKLPNAKYIDVFNVQFGGSDVNDGDCFHPSTAGHALLSDEEWCASQWSTGDISCSP